MATSLMGFKKFLRKKGQQVRKEVIKMRRAQALVLLILVMIALLAPLVAEAGSSEAKPGSGGVPVNIPAIIGR